MKKRVTIIFLLLFLCSPLLFAAEPPEGSYIEAVQLFTDKQYKKAKPLLEQIVKADVENDGAWYYLGLCNAYEGETDAAIRALAAAIALDKDNYWYRNALAAVYRTIGEEDLLISTYEDIIRDFPQKVDVSYELLSLYMKKELYDKALGALDEIEGEIGLTDETVRTRYDILRRQDKSDEALQVLTDYNEKFSSPSILSITGDHYLGEYSDSLALSCFSEALELDSDYIPALLGRAEALRLGRRYNDYFESIGDFMDRQSVPPDIKSTYLQSMTRSLDPKFIRLHLAEFDTVTDKSVAAHPTDSTVLTGAGIYYYATARTDKAIDLFSTAAEQYPDSPSLEISRLQLLSSAERWTQLREASEKAFVRFHEVAFLELANAACYNLKDYDAIIRNCEKVLILRKDDSDVKVGCYSIMGDMYHQKGNSKQAFKCYDKALKINPDYVPVLNNYAYFLSITGRKLRKAYSMSKKTVEAEPDNPTYLDTFAWILHLLGRDIEAKPVFKHAMLYGGKDSPVILDHYAEVLYALGEKDLAGVYWNMAKNKNRGGEVPDLDERIAERMGK